jgi:hypothetical protein
MAIFRRQEAIIPDPTRHGDNAAADQVTPQGRRRTWPIRALESLLFCVWYLLTNVLYSVAASLIDAWAPPSASAGAAMWTGFAGLALPFVFAVWYIGASHEPGLRWSRIILIGLLCVLAPFAVVVFLSAGMALGLYPIILPTIPVAIVATWIFDRLRAMASRRGA